MHPHSQGVVNNMKIFLISQLLILGIIVTVKPFKTLQLQSAFSILNSINYDLITIQNSFEMLQHNSQSQQIQYHFSTKYKHSNFIELNPSFPKFWGALKVALFVNQKTSDLEKWEKLLSPSFRPLVRTKSDLWIFFTENEETLSSFLLKSKAKYKLGLFTNPNHDGLSIRTICSFCNGGNPQIFTKEKLSLADIFKDHTTNLYGYILRVSFPAVRAMIETYPTLSTNNGKRGIWTYLFNEYYVPKLNCSYRMTLSTGKGTGGVLPNGTWIGVVGDVTNGIADVGFSTISSSERIRVASFTDSFIYVSYLHFVTSVGEKIYSPMAHLWPFTVYMWGCIIASTIVAAIFIQGLTFLVSFLNLGNSLSFQRRGQISEKKWTIRHQIFFFMSSYLDQDSVLPTFSPLRSFVALWLFFALVVTTIYRSKMVSLLAFPLIGSTPQTLKELVMSEYKVGFMKHGDAAYNVLKSSKDPTYVKLVKEMDVITGPGLECMEKVTKGKYACFGYALATAYLKAANLSDSDLRKLKTPPEATFNIVCGLVLQPGSQLLETFDKILRWVRPFHLLAIWDERDLHKIREEKRAFWTQTNQTEKLGQGHGNDDGDNDNLNLNNVSGAFFVVVLLNGFSVIIFLVELLRVKCKRGGVV